MQCQCMKLNLTLFKRLHLTAIKPLSQILDIHEHIHETYAMKVYEVKTDALLQLTTNDPLSLLNSIKYDAVIYITKLRFNVVLHKLVFSKAYNS